MPAAMVEDGSCGDRGELGSLALEAQLSAAEQEHDQRRQGEAAEDPEQAGDDADHDTVAGDGIPRGVDEVPDGDVDGGGSDRARGGRWRGQADVIGM